MCSLVVEVMVEVEVGVQVEVDVEVGVEVGVYVDFLCDFFIFTVLGEFILSSFSNPVFIFRFSGAGSVAVVAARDLGGVLVSNVLICPTFVLRLGLSVFVLADLNLSRCLCLRPTLSLYSRESTPVGGTASW